MKRLASLKLLHLLRVKIAVVFFAARNIFWVVALESVNVEDGAKAAAVWTGNTFDADVELSAVSWVGVSGVVAWLVGFGWVWAHKSVGHLGLVASLDMVSPDAHSLVIVVGKAGWAFVAGGLTVPAGVEDAAVGWIGEDAVQSGTVGSAYWGLEIRSHATVDGEGIGTVFTLGVRVVEHETVAAGLQGGGAVITSPVLVAALDVWVESGVIGTVEAARVGLRSGWHGGHCRCQLSVGLGRFLSGLEILR